MAANPLTGTIAALINECDFDVRRDVAMIFKRIGEEQASDIGQVLWVASLMGRGYDPGPAMPPRTSGNFEATRTVLRYLDSFGRDDRAKAELQRAGELMMRMVQACDGLAVLERNQVLASAIRKAVREKSVTVRPAEPDGPPETAPAGPGCR